MGWACMHGFGTDFADVCSAHVYVPAHYCVHAAYVPTTAIAGGSPARTLIMLML